MRVECPECGAAGKLKAMPKKAIRCPKCDTKWTPREVAREADEGSAPKARARSASAGRRKVRAGAGGSRGAAAGTKRRAEGGGSRTREESPAKPSRSRRGSGGNRPVRGPSAKGGGRRRSDRGEDDLDDDRRRPARRRNNTPLYIAGGIGAVVIIALVVAIVMFTSEGAPLEARAQQYIRAVKSNDTEALFGLVSPAIVDKIEEDGGEAGLSAFKARLGKSAEDEGAEVSMKFTDIKETGDTATMKLHKVVTVQGKETRNEHDLRWERIRGVWYLRPKM